MTFLKKKAPASFKFTKFMLIASIFTSIIYSIAVTVEYDIILEMKVAYSTVSEIKVAPYVP